MPTVVDALVVTLGLDSSEYAKGQAQAKQQTEGLKVAVEQAQADMTRALGVTIEQFKAWTAAATTSDKAEQKAGGNIRDSFRRTGQEAARAGKEMEAGGKAAAQFFAQAKIEALGLIGTLVGAGGMLAFASNTTRSLADLGRAALNIGVAVPELNAFQNVIERNGGSADSATASMKGLVDQIERFKVFGDPSVFKFLNPIGANINDTPLAIWQKFVEFADKHRNDPALVNLIGHGLGFDQGLINASLQIKGAADAARQLADEAGRVATPEFVQNAQDLVKAWEDLQHQAIFTGEAVLNNLSPALKSMLVWGKDEIEQNPALIEALTAITGGLVGLGAIRISAGLMGLTGLSKVIGGLVGFLERLAPYAALLLSLHGDTPTHEDPVQPGGEFFGGNGRVAQWWEHNMPGFLGGGARAPDSNTTDLTMTPEKRAFLDTLATGEGADYNVLNGGERFTDMTRHPNRVGRGGTSTAAGRYQFITSTWEDEQRRLGLTDFSPQSQDKAAWDLAYRTYRANTGRDLGDDLLHPAGHEKDLATATNKVWPSQPGGSQQTTTQQQFDDRLKANLEREKQRDLDRQGTPHPDLPNPPSSGPNRIPAPSPISSMLPGEPEPIVHPSVVPYGPDLSHLTNRPVGATFGDWLHGRNPRAPAPDYNDPPAPRIDPALVPQPGASVSNYHHQNDNSVSVSIGAIHTQATDAKGIAADMRDAATDAFVQQANRGLQ